MLLLYSEKKVREKLCVSATDFRRIRVEELKLQELSEWVKLRGGAIALTAGGLGRMLEFIRGNSLEAAMPLTFGDCVIGAEGSESAKNGLEPEELTVLKLYPNRHLLRCTRADGEVVNVWVPDNRKFLMRMKLNAAPTGPAGQFRFVGRCPRRKGRY